MTLPPPPLSLHPRLLLVAAAGGGRFRRGPAARSTPRAPLAPLLHLLRPDPPLPVSMERTGRRRGRRIRDSSRGIPSPARGGTHPDAAAAPRLAHQLDAGPWR